MSGNADERCRQATGISRRPWKPASGTCEASGPPAAGPMSGPTARRRSTRSTRQDRRRGPGHPDIGPFGAKPLRNGRLKQGQTPEAGVVEVKPARDDAWLTANSGRVSGCWGLYRLAGSAAGFEPEPQHPRAFANAAGPARSGPVRVSRTPQSRRQTLETVRFGPFRQERTW